jgi:hypothetical protein
MKKYCGFPYWKMKVLHVYTGHNDKILAQLVTQVFVRLDNCLLCGFGCTTWYSLFVAFECAGLKLQFQFN